MHRLWIVAVALCVGCGAEPEPLMASLDGAWALELVLFDGELRAGAAELAWSVDEAVLSGTIEMSDPDLLRSYELLGAQDIDTLGIALQLVEQAGVRQLFVELAPPSQGESFGGWRTRWGCTDAIDNQCGEDGTLTLSR